MPSIRELRKTLIRGARVRVRDTPSKSLLHDQRVFVKSEALAPCRGEHRCAADRKCNGYAVFVCKEDPATLEGGAGWRKGASKFCLTHLDSDDGEPLTSIKGQTTSRKNVVEEAAVEEIPAQTFSVEEFSEVGSISEPVSWVELAHAASSAQGGDRSALQQLILLARRLKASEDVLQRQLIQSQGLLIEALSRDPAEDEGPDEEPFALSSSVFDPILGEYDEITEKTRDGLFI